MQTLSRGVERREFQRLRIDSPIPATFDGHAVSIIEAGILGARIRHGANLEAARSDLRFSHQGRPIVLRCDVVRTLPSSVEGQFESGLRFVAAVGESGDHLRSLLVQLVTHAFEERHDASATRLLQIRAVDGDRTVRGADAQFVSYRLDNGGWKRRAVFLPEQPPVGFTVARGEDSEEMQRLCAVYEASDEEGRRLIRMFAELSVSDRLQIPPAK